MKDDEWSDELRVLGNNLGRFIYLLDAYDDLEKDEKKNNYNVFKYHKDVEGFDTFAENILKAYMAGCARAFERLPILANAELLRNIITLIILIRIRQKRCLSLYSRLIIR